MASKISSECSAIQRAIGDKFGQILQSIGGVVFGFGISFIWGWKLTLILMAFIPLIAVLGAMIGKLFVAGLQQNLKAYSQSAGYAEQALSAIKVVHTYGQEEQEMKMYNKYLIRAKEFARKQLFKTVMGVAMLYLVLNCFYAYTFFFGGYLRYNHIPVYEGVEYTGGRVIAIMFCVVVSCFRLGGIGDHTKAIVEGRVAGKMAWNVIEAVP